MKGLSPIILIGLIVLIGVGVFVLGPFLFIFYPPDNAMIDQFSELPDFEIQIPQPMEVNNRAALGQSFVPTQDHLLGIQLRVKEARDGASQNLIIEIFNNAGGVPGSSLWGISVSPGYLAEHDQGWSYFDFGSLALTPGQTYWIVISSPGHPYGDLYDYGYVWEAHFSYGDGIDAYPQGVALSQNLDSGNWYTMSVDEDIDFTFRTYYMPTMCDADFFPGDQRCDSNGDYILICNEDGSIDVLEACQMGYKCEETSPDVFECTLFTPECGNGIPETGENCNNCPEDFPPEFCVECGDGIVEDPETCDDGNTVTETCAYGEQQCMVCGPVCQLVPGTTSYCGDFYCDQLNEDQTTCPEDCGYLLYCGDGICSEEIGEDSTTCLQDCPLQAFCGDGTCSGDETYITCPADCDAPPVNNGYDLTLISIVIFIALLLSLLAAGIYRLTR